MHAIEDIKAYESFYSLKLIGKKIVFKLIISEKRRYQHFTLRKRIKDFWVHSTRMTQSCSLKLICHEIWILLKNTQCCESTEFYLLCHRLINQIDIFLKTTVTILFYTLWIFHSTGLLEFFTDSTNEALRWTIILTIKFFINTRRERWYSYNNWTIWTYCCISISNMSLLFFPKKNAQLQIKICTRRSINEWNSITHWKESMAAFFRS